MRCKKVSEKGISSNIPSSNVMFDSSASVIPKYEYNRIDNLGYTVSENYRFIRDIE